MSACEDQALLEQLVRLRIDVVDAAILVVRNPDQNLSRKLPSSRSAFSDLIEIDRHVVEQELRVGVSVPMELPLTCWFLMNVSMLSSDSADRRSGGS